MGLNSERYNFQFRFHHVKTMWLWKFKFILASSIFIYGLPSSTGKEAACNAGDPSPIPESGRSSGEGIGYPLQYSWASLMAETEENPLIRWETWVWSLVWEDPVEESMATHSCILARRISWTEQPRGLLSRGL